MNKAERAIRDCLTAVRDLSIDEAEAAIDAVSDHLFPADRSEGMMNESILDGLRWGIRAGVIVEFGGGTIVRTRRPGGEAITHEWRGAVSTAEIAEAIARGVPTEVVNPCDED